MSSNIKIVNPGIPAEESNKRVVGNTSFDDVPSPESGGLSTKRPNTEQGSELPQKLVTEEFLVSTLGTMFAEFEINIDLKFAHINARLNNVEEAASSSELRVQEDLLTRVVSVGTKDELSEAETLVKQVYHYVKDLTQKHPGLHVFLPGFCQLFVHTQTRL